MGEVLSYGVEDFPNMDVLEVPEVGIDLASSPGLKRAWYILTVHASVCLGKLYNIPVKYPANISFWLCHRV